MLVGVLRMRGTLGESKEDMDGMGGWNDGVYGIGEWGGR